MSTSEEEVTVIRKTARIIMAVMKLTMTVKNKELKVGMAGIEVVAGEI